MIKRTTELRRQIRELARRAAHLAAEARAVESGKTEVRRRFGPAGKALGRDETLKFQPSAAVGYWRELRETEERLDAKLGELRSLAEGGLGGALRVEIVFDGGPG